MASSDERFDKAYGAVFNGGTELEWLPLDGVSRIKPVGQSENKHDAVDIVLLGASKAMAATVLSKILGNKGATSTVRALWRDGSMLWKYSLSGDFEPTTEIDGHRKVYLVLHGEAQVPEPEYVPPLTQDYNGGVTPIPIVPVTQRPVDPRSWGFDQLRISQGAPHNIVHHKNGTRTRIPLYVDQLDDCTLDWIIYSPTAPFQTLRDLNETKPQWWWLWMLSALVIFLAILYFDEVHYEGKYLAQTGAYVEHTECYHHTVAYLEKLHGVATELWEKIAPKVEPPPNPNDWASHEVCVREDKADLQVRTGEMAVHAFQRALHIIKFAVVSVYFRTLQFLETALGVRR